MIRNICIKTSQIKSLLVKDDYSIYYQLKKLSARSGCIWMLTGLRIYGHAFLANVSNPWQYSFFFFRPTLNEWLGYSFLWCLTYRYTVDYCWNWPCCCFGWVCAIHICIKCNEITRALFWYAAAYTLNIVGRCENSYSYRHHAHK